jgi:hypothetical protein
MPLRFPGSYCRLHIGSRFVVPDGFIRRASPLVAGARFVQGRTSIEVKKFI